MEFAMTQARDAQVLTRCVRATASPMKVFGITVASLYVSSTTRIQTGDTTTRLRVSVVFRVDHQATDERVTRCIEMFLVDVNRLIQTLRLKVGSIYVDQFRSNKCEF